MSRTLKFEADSGGGRLDRFLADSTADLSRSRLQGLINDGQVTVDGHVVKASHKLREGECIVVVVPDPKPADLVPWDIPLDVVYEDDDLLVVDKPAGMAVHPGPGHLDDTLANAVLAHSPGLEGIGGEQRPGIVHRLDKDTSGLIVVAKNERAHTSLSDQFKERSVTKGYLALVHGQVSPPEAIIDAPIGRHPRDRKRMTIVEKGREARTYYKTIDTFKKFTLLKVQPRTGRTHQIRVHLASMRHRVVGDAVYGHPHPSLDRHFLHANRLGFEHPSTGEHVEWSSDLPAELTEFLSTLPRS